MSKTRDTGFLGNVVKVDSNGDISLMHGSTMLMQISSSGAVTTTGVISGSNALTSSYSQNSELLDNLDSTSFVFTSSFNTYSSSMSTRVSNNESTGSTLTSASASLNIASGSFSTRVTRIEGNYATTGSNVFLGAQTVCANITSTGTIIAQTLNVQQVTSSIVYSSGSNTFGNQLTDIQQFTGSLRITGSGVHFIQGGCVGIGCVSPGYTLDVNGILNVCTSTGSQIRLLNYGGSSAKIRGTQGTLGIEACGALTLETNGANERLRIESSGIASFTCQVCSPNFIASSTCSTAGLRVYGASGCHQWDIYLNSNNLRFSDNSSGGCFVVDTIGTFGNNVGIGIGAPLTRLHLYDGAPTYILLTNTAADGVSNAIQGGMIGQARGYSNNLAQMANILFRNKNTAAWYKGEITFSTNDSDGTNPAISPVERLRIFSDGVSCFSNNVCVGGILTVNGATIEVNCSTTANTDARINFYTKNAVNGDRISIYGYNLAATTANCEITYEGLGYCCTNNQGYINFQTKSGGAWCNTMYLINGRVGIGTATPCSKLHVAGGGIVIDNNQDYRSLNSSGLGRTILYLDSSNRLLLNNDDGLIRISTSGNIRACITSTGEIDIACQMCTSGILNKSFRISNARVNGTWQEWVGQGITLTNNSAIALFCINSQYDNLIVDLAAWIDQGAWSPVSYRFNIGYNVGTSYVAGLGAVSAICGLQGGTTYNETWCWKNCSGGNISNSAISLRIFGRATNEQISTGGRDLIVSSYLTRVS